MSLPWEYLTQMRLPFRSSGSSFFPLWNFQTAVVDWSSDLLETDWEGAVKCLGRLIVFNTRTIKTKGNPDTPNKKKAST